MRVAGQEANDPEVFQAIWKHLKTDGVPDQAANQMAAEMVTHGDDTKRRSKKKEKENEDWEIMDSKDIKKERKG